MLGFSFRGVHTSAFLGLVVKTLNNPLIASKRLKRIAIPGRDGIYTFEDGYENKLLEFECILKGGSIQERRLRIRQIAVWLSKTGELVLDHEPDKTYRVVRSVCDVGLSLDQSMDSFKICFETEPFQYAGVQTVSVDNPTSFVITNNGSTVADTILTISGSGNVAVACNMESFTLTGMTEALTLDSKKMLVYNNVMVNNLGKHSGVFIRLSPGGNTIVVTGSVSNISVQFRDTYI